VVVVRLGAGHFVRVIHSYPSVSPLGQELGTLTIPRQVAYVEAGGGNLGRHLSTIENWVARSLG
jgi:hypothetical protein